MPLSHGVIVCGSRGDQYGAELLDTEGPLRPQNRIIRIPEKSENLLSVEPEHRSGRSSSVALTEFHDPRTVVGTSVLGKRGKCKG